jgi:hypothetical protein
MPPSTVADMMIHHVDDGRPGRTGGPHGVVGSRWRHAVVGLTDLPLTLYSTRWRYGVHTVRRGAEFVRAGVGLR